MEASCLREFEFWRGCGSRAWEGANPKVANTMAGAIRRLEPVFKGKVKFPVSNGKKWRYLRTGFILVNQDRFPPSPADPFYPPPGDIPSFWATAGTPPISLHRSICDLTAVHS